MEYFLPMYVFLLIPRRNLISQQAFCSNECGAILRMQRPTHALHNYFLLAGNIKLLCILSTSYLQRTQTSIGSGDATSSIWILYCSKFTHVLCHGLRRLSNIFYLIINYTHVLLMNMNRNEWNSKKATSHFLCITRGQLACLWYCVIYWFVMQ